MSTAVDYCNRALSLIGAETITALDMSESPNAATCVSLYEPTVDELLGEWPWRFAVGREQLSRLTTTPPDTRYAYEYALPADTLRIVRMDQPNADWMLYRDPASGYRRVYSNADSLLADLVRKPDPALFPAHFQKALVHRLAAVLAMPITRRPEFAQLYLGMAAASVSAAKAQDWNEQPWVEMDDGNIFANSRLVD